MEKPIPADHMSATQQANESEPFPGPVFYSKAQAEEFYAFEISRFAEPEDTMIGYRDQDGVTRRLFDQTETPGEAR